MAQSFIRVFPLPLLLFIVLTSAACLAQSESNNLDTQLSSLIVTNRIVASEPINELNPSIVELGTALFFDRELSGNRDVSCATCHHPSHHSSDGRVVSIGTGGLGLGPERLMGSAVELVPRNATDLFNRSSPEWHTMFWDGRIERLPDGSLESPADEELPAKLNNVLVAQALFPITSRIEMRGEKGDLDVFGQKNELANIEDWQFTLIWDAVMTRLLNIPAYVELFRAAFPEIEDDAFTIVHFGEALAAHQTSAYTFYDAPWDLYLGGDTDALTNAQKQGAILFYGQAGCASCHSGNLFTNQEYHHLTVPQIGPGKARNFDFGRYHADQDPAYFAFRTPPLRNVTLTSPYMHNGAYATLEEVIAHHIRGVEMLHSYDADQLPQEIAVTYRNDPYALQLMIDTLPSTEPITPNLTGEEINYLLAFLEALTSPSAQNLGHLIPDTVPSGLPVDR